MNQMRKMAVGLALLGSMLVNANVLEVPISDKPLFGLAYDIAIIPAVDRILHSGSKSDLVGLYRASLEFSYPYFHNLAFGVSLDYTLARSANDGDPRLDVSRASSKVSSTYLGITTRIRPQIPIVLGNWDLILYAEAQIGFGTSSPLAFGTQPLSDYRYEGTRNFPTPFPLMFETTPKVGVQVFGWRFFGIDVACGFRTLWIVHPMVAVRSSEYRESMPSDDRKAICYDITAPFLQAGLKFAF